MPQITSFDNMVLIHIPADQFLVLGLELMGLPVVNPKKNVERFLSIFVTTPAAASALFHDLQTATIAEAHVDSINFKYFMITLNWLKSYKVESEMAASFKLQEDTVRKWSWCYTKHIQALKEAKIRWDVLNRSTDILLVSDDSVHFLIEPRKQPSTKSSSKKFGKKAALTYEVAIAIRYNQVVLLNGPYPAATHDMTMFTSANGVGPRLAPGQQAVTDRLYSGPQVCVRNPFDSDELKGFKKRVRARHETFNGRIKVFNILDTRFRHGVSKHKAVFEACCVIVQYDMETGRPLFRVA